VRPWNYDGGLLQKQLEAVEPTGIGRMKVIDLNCDMGESFGAYRLGQDEAVMQYVSSANIACGWHAGDPLVMDRTVKMAVEHGVGVGAHPGYPDLMGFGRRHMDCSAKEIRSYVVYQVGALMAFCKAHRVRMRHVKPHGTLYLAAADNNAVAGAVAEAVATVDASLLYVTLAGPKGEVMTEVAEKVGVRVMYEAFPDRNYAPDGILVPRRRADATITDPEEVARRALMVAAEGRIRAVDGSYINLKADTICIHGDNVHALENVKRIRELLEAEGLTIRPMGLREECVDA